MFSEYDFTPKKTWERVLLLGVVTVLILFGTHTHAISMVAFVICALVIVFDKTHFKLMLMTYLLMMAHVFKISPSGMSYFTFLMFLYIGVKLVEEKKILWTAVFFIIFVIAVQVVRSQLKVNEDLKLAGNILFIGCALGETNSFSDRDKEKLCITYILSVIVSSLMRFFDSGFFKISSYTDGMNTEAYGAGSTAISRFAGLYQDPNYYSVNLLSALCLIVILYYRGRTSVAFCGLSAAVILYFGTLTYSKSFILILSIPLFMFLYANHRIGRYDVQVISVALIAAGIMLILLINPDYISNMVRRVETKDSITTGRSDTWLYYIDLIYHRPDIMLFGIGIGGALPEGIHAPHSSYIDMIYYLGIFGSIFLLAAIVSSHAQYKHVKKKNPLNYSVLLVILVTYFFLSQMHSYEVPLHLMLSFMVLYQWDLNERERRSAPAVCLPILPELNEEKIKTLF